MLDVDEAGDVDLLEDQTCSGCGKEWDDEKAILQTKWTECETQGSCHWTCPQCLAVGLDYKDEYYYGDCRVSCEML